MSKYIFKELTEAKVEEWAELLKGADEVSPFVTIEWFKAYSAATGEKYQLIGCYSNDEKLVGGFGFFYREKWGAFKLIVNLLGVDSYIVFIPRQSQFESKKESYYFEIYNAFIAYLEGRFDYLELTLNCSSKDIRPFKWSGYTEEIRYTYRGEINDPESMMKSFNPDVRNKIKKAIKLDYRVSFDSLETEFEVGYKLISRSLTKNGEANIMGKKQFVKLCSDLAKENKVIVANIYLGEIPVASRIILYTNDVAVDFQAGGNEEYFNSGLNQLLSYKIFEELYTRKVALFDFRGANTPSVAKYKAGFNLVAEPYYCLKKNNNKMLAALLTFKKLLGK